MLLVGESGGGHVNPAMWAYSVSHSTMVRIMNVPQGYDISAVSYQTLNGSAYILASLVTPPGARCAVACTRLREQAGAASRRWFVVQGLAPASCRT